MKSEKKPLNGLNHLSYYADSDEEETSDIQKEEGCVILIHIR